MRTAARLSVRALVAVSILSVMPAASAQVYVNVPPPILEGVDVGARQPGGGAPTAPGLESAEVSANLGDRERAPVGLLAITGGDLLFIALLAIGMVVIGETLRRRARST